jgi:hypothetical protein
MTPSSQRLARRVPTRERTSSSSPTYAGGYTARNPASAHDGNGALGFSATVNVQIVLPMPHEATAAPTRSHASRFSLRQSPRAIAIPAAASIALL